MATAKAQRTLVKSPPELWCELGDPAALERHLSGYGEITIKRSEPERLLEWEAPAASGVVELKASGWGTRVMLSLTPRRRPARDTAETSGAAAADETVEASAGRAAHDAATAATQAAGAETPCVVQRDSAEHPAATSAAPQAREAPQAQAAPDRQEAPDAQAAPDAPASQVAARYEPPSSYRIPPAQGDSTDAIEPEPPAELEPQWKRLKRRGMRGLLARIGLRPGKRSASDDSQQQQEPAAAKIPAETVQAPPRGEPARERCSERAPGQVAMWVPEETQVERREQAPAPDSRPGTDPGQATHATDSGSFQALAKTALEPSAIPARNRFDAQAAATAPSAPRGAAVPSASGLTTAPEAALAAEPSAGEVTDAGALLSALLDRLGEAHHRPFSRN